jgi:hypothetical protein
MNWIRITCLAIALGSFASPSSAAEVNLAKASAEQLKAICQKVGGSFSQSGNGYGCGTDCAGGKGSDCTVFCSNTANRCTAQVGGARRPKTFEQALAPRSKRKK